MKRSFHQQVRQQYIQHALLCSTFCCFSFGCKATKTGETASQPPAQANEEAVISTPSSGQATIPESANAKTAQAILQKFDFGSGEVQAGYQQVLPATTYTKERGYGIISKTPVKAINREGEDALRSDFITSKEPFYFTVDLPEGNYEVTVLLGDLQGTSTTTVKAESRRLMLEEVQTPSGKVESHTFTVNVRTPRINAEERIRLKPREVSYLNWDDKLTLEFNNDRPCVAAIEIRKVDDVITMYLAGNSTVVDQEYEPWAAWGQMIPRFFKPGVVVTNYAESGESLKAFVGRNGWRRY